MKKVLVIKSSASGEASISNQLVTDTLARLEEQDHDLKVLARDLDSDPVPHLLSGTLAALGRELPIDEPARLAREMSDDLVCELNAADIVIIGAPMYNFGIPSTLKSWFDHVLRAGVTFRYTEHGSEGLLKGKRAIIVETRGGIYSEGPAVALDSQEPHLRNLLNFIGINDVAFIRAEGLAMGPDHRRRGVEEANAQVGHLFEPEIQVAA